MFILLVQFILFSNRFNNFFTSSLSPVSTIIFMKGDIPLDLIQFSHKSNSNSPLNPHKSLPAFRKLVYFKNTLNIRETFLDQS